MALIISDPKKIHQEIFNSSLEPDKARELAQKECDLELQVTILSDECAKEFIPHKYDLQLFAPVRLTFSEIAAEHLSNHQGTELHLINVHELNTSKANLLSNYNNSLTISVWHKSGEPNVIPDEIIEELSKHKGDELSLFTDTLSDAACASLSNHSGKLRINGLNHPMGMDEVDPISSEGKKLLKKHSGPVYCPKGLARYFFIKKK